MTARIALGLLATGVVCFALGIALGVGLERTSTAAPTAINGSRSNLLPAVSATAPPMPASVAGYAAAGATVLTTVRAFEQGNVIAPFHVAMNGCADGLTTTRWRSLGAEVRVENYYGDPFQADPLSIHVVLSQLSNPTTGLAGLTVSSACQQPIFFTLQPNVLVDVAVEYQSWTAAP